MSEIIFAQSLRAYLEDDGKNVAVLAGLSDQKISKALSVIHEKPALLQSMPNRRIRRR